MQPGGPSWTVNRGKSSFRLRPSKSFAMMSASLCCSHSGTSPMLLRSSGIQLSRPLDDTSPATVRRASLSLLKCCRHSCTKACRSSASLGKHFRHLPQFTNGFEALLKDRKIKELRREYLDPIRDKFAFHADRRAIAHTLTGLPAGDYVFALCGSTRASDVHMCLADDVAIWHVTGHLAAEGPLEGAHCGHGRSDRALSPSCPPAPSRRRRRTRCQEAAMAPRQYSGLILREAGCTPNKRLKPSSAPGLGLLAAGPWSVHTQRKSDNSLRARSRWQLKRRTLDRHNVFQPLKDREATAWCAQPSLLFAL